MQDLRYVELVDNTEFQDTLVYLLTISVKDAYALAELAAIFPD